MWGKSCLGCVSVRIHLPLGDEGPRVPSRMPNRVAWKRCEFRRPQTDTLVPDDRFSPRMRSASIIHWRNLSRGPVLEILIDRSSYRQLFPPTFFGFFRPSAREPVPENSATDTSREFHLAMRFPFPRFSMSVLVKRYQLVLIERIPRLRICKINKGSPTAATN